MYFGAWRAGHRSGHNSVHSPTTQLPCEACHKAQRTIRGTIQGTIRCTASVHGSGARRSARGRCPLPFSPLPCAGRRFPLGAHGAGRRAEPEVRGETGPEGGAPGTGNPPNPLPSAPRSLPAARRSWRRPAGGAGPPATAAARRRPRPTARRSRRSGCGSAGTSSGGGWPRSVWSACESVCVCLCVRLSVCLSPPGTGTPPPPQAARPNA